MLKWVVMFGLLIKYIYLAINGRAIKNIYNLMNGRRLKTNMGGIGKLHFVRCAVIIFQNIVLIFITGLIRDTWNLTHIEI
jgi:hypothetical protein